MPRRRRLAKNRTISDHEAVRLWSTAFQCQWDFFNDLEALRLNTRAEVDAAMPEAWKRWGRLWLNTRVPEPFERTPWALENLGEPEQCQ